MLRWPASVRWWPPVNTNLAIENSRESSLADYASLSVILISVLLMCFSIVLLANEAKRSATILAPAAFSEGSAAKTSRAANLRLPEKQWSRLHCHSWFVQRGDGLILRTLSPNLALTPKLQHYRPIDSQRKAYPTSNSVLLIRSRRSSP